MSKAKVKTTGLKNAAAFFEMSGMRFKKKDKHHPFLVFVPEDETNVRVDLVENAEQLVKYPAATKVMAQWPGKSRSDFFQFTVGQLRRHIRENPRHVCQLI